MNKLKEEIAPKPYTHIYTKKNPHIYKHIYKTSKSETVIYK